MSRTMMGALGLLLVHANAQAWDFGGLQPAVHLQWQFGSARAAPDLQLSARWSYADPVLEGWLQRLDPDARRDRGSQGLDLRDLRAAVPAVLGVDLSPARGLQLRSLGVDLAGWRALAVDGTEDGNWYSRHPWAVAGIVAGAAVSALVIANGGNTIEIGNEDTTNQGCSTFSGPLSDPEVDPTCGIDLR